MGSYIYTKRAKVVEATDIATGAVVNVNTYEYATKPYWNLWDVGRCASYHDEWEKREVRYYHLLRGKAASTVDKLLARDKLSRFFTPTYKGKIGFEKNDEAPVFECDAHAAWIIDDAMGDRSMPQIGVLRRRANDMIQFVPNSHR